MRILITGEKGYLGKRFELWMNKWPTEYSIEFISVRDEKWKEKDFSNYDVILHLAALVHKKEKSSMSELYYRINKNLTVELSEKAKNEGVKQFVFLSTMAVYGLEGNLKKKITISNDTKENPITYYGRSKLQAEKEISQMQSENYNISIVRPPMIYGPNCPGNFSKLKELIRILPVFPNLDSVRSMIYIDNLCEFLRTIIIHNKAGIFHPQNKEYVNIQDLAKAIANINKKKMVFSKTIASFIITFASIKVFKKMFGSLIYSVEMLSDEEQVSTYDFIDTVNKSI